MLLIKSRIISPLIISIISVLRCFLDPLSSFSLHLFFSAIIPTQVNHPPILLPCKLQLVQTNTSKQNLELCLLSVNPYLHIHRAEDFYLERNLDTTSANSHTIIVIYFKAYQTKRRREGRDREG